MILKRQTCGQRSSMSAGNKRRALENYFYERICPIFLKSKCRGDWHLSLCTVWVLCTLSGYLRKENRCAMPTSDFSCRRNTFLSGSCHCAAVLFSQVKKKCTDLDVSLLYILILRTYRKNNFLALSVCFPQPCSSAGRMFAASESCLNYYRRIVSFPQRWIRRNAL